MNEITEIRRRITAEQIKNAMARAGMSRSQLAAALGKKPSVITQWLSGNHNFTIDMLAEISHVLGTEITGVDTPIATKHLVHGYGDDENKGKTTGTLNDSVTSAYCIDFITLSPNEYTSLNEQATRIGVSLRRYAELILGKEALRISKDEEEEKRLRTQRFLDNCVGMWSGPEYDGLEEKIYATRTIWMGEDL